MSNGYPIDTKMYEELTRLENTIQESTEAVESAMSKIARAQQQRIEYAIRGAIRAGFDGVDINRSPHASDGSIKSIEPWNYPAPEEANGYRTERYSWDWFSEDELARLLTDDGLVDELSWKGRRSDDT